jgi:hypothetical protein
MQLQLKIADPSFDDPCYLGWIAILIFFPSADPPRPALRFHPIFDFPQKTPKTLISDSQQNFS